MTTIWTDILLLLASRLELWKRMTDRVEELYQRERNKFEKLDTIALRGFIIERCPNLEESVNRVSLTSPSYLPAAADGEEQQHKYKMVRLGLYSAHMFVPTGTCVG